MEAKDTFYILGIIVTVVTSSFTLMLGFKNRRNSLREHLYKEQIIFFTKFLGNVNKLNFEIESILNNPSKRSNNLFYKILEVISNEYYNYEFLIPNEISGLVHNLIFKGNQFYSMFLTTDDNKIRTTYSNYFDSYTEMLNAIKEFVGTTVLSNENKELHLKNKKISGNNILKLITEVAEKVTINHF